MHWKFIKEKVEWVTTKLKLSDKLLLTAMPVREICISCNIDKQFFNTIRYKIFF